MTHLVVRRHSLKARKQVIARGGIKICLTDFAGHLIFLAIEHRAGFPVNLHLQVHEQVQIFLLIIRIFLHQLGKGLPLDELREYGPFTLDHVDTQDSRDMQACLLNARLIQRLIQNIGL